MVESCEKVVRKMWESWEKFVRNFSKKSQARCEKVKKKWRVSCEKVMKMLWESCEKIVKKLCEIYEKLLRKLLKSCEKVVRNFWESCEKHDHGFAFQAQGQGKNHLTCFFCFVLMEILLFCRLLNHLGLKKTVFWPNIYFLASETLVPGPTINQVFMVRCNCLGPLGTF